jgi:hypothetical protein
MKRRRYLAHGREWHTEDEKLVSAVQRLHLVSSWSSHPAFCPKPHTPLHTGGKVTGSLARLRYIWPSASPLSDTALRRHETSNLRTVSSSSNLRLEIPIPVLSLQLVHFLC